MCMNTSVKLINLTEKYTALSEIWRQSFPEDADFTESFLKEAASHIECIAAFEKSEPVSAAYFLPATLCINDREWRARYVYGVGTLPAFRGKGYAGKVLEAAVQYIEADVFYLYPATSPLRAFYKKHGYKDAFTQETVCADSLLGKEELTIYETVPFDAQRYAALREQFLRESAVSYAAFPVQLLQVLLRHFSLIRFDGGAALLFETENTIYLPELLCDAESAHKLVCMLQHQFGDKKIIACIPGTKEASCMLLPITENAQRELRNIEKTPFFGAVFDI